MVRKKIQKVNIPRGMIRGWRFLVLAGLLVQVARIRSLAPSCGICPQGNESGAAGDFPASLLTAQTYPIGNAALTYASFSVVGTTGQDDQREFLVSLGLVSDRGNQVAHYYNIMHLYFDTVTPVTHVDC